VGILTNGVLLDSHEPTWSYDSCNGHSDKKHMYHYHIPPQCFLKALGVPVPETAVWWMDNFATESRSSGSIKQVLDFAEMSAQWPDKIIGFTEPVVVGFARDGYPIFAPYDEQGNVQRGLEYGGDLDECNGKTNSKGQYGYYLTVDPPFAPPCFRGEKGIFTSLATDKVCPSDGISNTIINSLDLVLDSVENASVADASGATAIECGGAAVAAAGLAIAAASAFV